MHGVGLRRGVIGTHVICETGECYVKIYDFREQTPYLGRENSVVVLAEIK